MNLNRILIASVALCAAGITLPMCLPTPDGCVATATRCNGQQAEICDGAARWTVVEDCNQVAAQSGGSWSCCAIPSDEGVAPDGGAGPDHICVPAGVCAGGAS